MQTDLDKRRYNLLKKAFKATKEALEFEEAMQKYQNRDYLTTTEFAHITGHSPQTISNYASSGRIKETKKKEGFWLIHKSELQRFLT